MSWGALLVNLGVTALTVAVLMLATFGYAMRTRVHAIMVAVWGVRLSAHIYLRAVGFGAAGKDMARSKGAAYADYVSRTSGFFPWPPSRRAGRG